MARPVPLQGYVRTSLPIMEGGDIRFLQKELSLVEQAFDAMVAMVPQVAVEAPRNPPDGAQRLARSPWRPVSGQTDDAWVWWDAVSGTWRYL